MLVSALLLTTLLAFQQPADPQAIQAKAQQAQAAFQSGRFADAVSGYRELTELLPDIPGLKMNLGMALYLNGQAAEAVAPLREAVKGDPSLAPAWLFLGTALLGAGQAGESIEPLRTYLRKMPGEISALQLLGDAYLQSGRPGQAAEVFREIVELDESSAPGWFGLGRSYEGLAGKAFEQLNQTAAETGYWFALIAESRVVQQQFSSAYFFFRKALEANPRMRGIHAAIADVYRKSEHADWAAVEEQKEIGLGAPDCAQEPYVCLFLEKKLTELLAKVQNENSPEALYWKVKACNQLAVESFNRLEGLPSSVELHQFRAEVQRNLNRHWESVAEWRKALELSPGNPGLLRELALSLYLNRNYEEAGRLVRELLAEDPGSAQLNFLAGDILLYQQNAAESVPFLEKAVQIDPGMTAGHSSLGRAYMSIGEDAKAIPHLKAALSEDEDGSLHYQLARAYQRTGKRESAQETLAAYQRMRKEQSRQQDDLKEEVQITPP